MKKKKKKNKRKAHYIRRSKNVRLPSRFIFFDVETYPVPSGKPMVLKLAYAVYWYIDKKTGVETIEWFDTTKSESLFDFIISKSVKYNNLRVLSANIWFDCRVSGILTHLKASGWHCKQFFARGHTFIALFERGNYRIDLVNVQNYFNIPVVTIGKSIGKPKLKVDFDRASMKDLRIYCKNDVDIIFTAFKALYYFIKDGKKGGIGYTIPSVAYSCYTHSFIPHNIAVHAEKDILDVERKAYFGGRCECFYIGKKSGEPYYKLDVNSMYPYVMRSCDYPVKLHKTGKNIPICDLAKIIDCYCYIAEVIVKTDKPVYAVRQNGKVIFPIGEFKTYLTTPSLLYALSQDHLKVIPFIIAYQKANLFKDYVDYFYTKRLAFMKEDNKAFSYICKILLNSLYGKFGQKSSTMLWEKKNEQENDFRQIIWQVQEQRYYVHQSFFGLEQMIIQKECEGLNSMPAIAAHVTDYARLYLWQLIEKAGIRNCFYVDTDSIIVNSEGYKRLKRFCCGKELGKLKVEATAKSFNIRGAKHYIFGSKRKIKGVPKKAVKLKGSRYKFQQFPTPLTELRQGIKPTYQTETVIKKLSGVYDKGIVTKSGRVNPFIF